MFMATIQLVLQGQFYATFVTASFLFSLWQCMLFPVL